MMCRLNIFSVLLGAAVIVGVEGASNIILRPVIAATFELKGTNYTDTEILETGGLIDTYQNGKGQLPNTERQSSLPFLLTSAAQPYVGDWSNGRGETLSITPTTIQFNQDDELTYKDLTKATDGTYFEIQITSRGKLNFFQKFLSLKLDGANLEMTGYDSYDDMHSGQNQGLDVTWISGSN